MTTKQIDNTAAAAAIAALHTRGRVSRETREEYSSLSALPIRQRRETGAGKRLREIWEEKEESRDGFDKAMCEAIGLHIATNPNVDGAWLLKPFSSDFLNSAVEEKHFLPFKSPGARYAKFVRRPKYSRDAPSGIRAAVSDRHFRKKSVISRKVKAGPDKGMIAIADWRERVASLAQQLSQEREEAIGREQRRRERAKLASKTFASVVAVAEALRGVHTQMKGGACEVTISCHSTDQVAAIARLVSEWAEQE